MKLIVDNVRCFAGSYEIPIRPLTVLVGENSSGKSTLLAILAAIFGPAGFPMRPRFNEPPYNLGGFETIVSQKRRGNGRGGHFSIGFAQSLWRGQDVTHVLASYKRANGRTELSEFSLKGPDGEVQLDRNQSGDTFNLSFKLLHKGKTESGAGQLNAKTLEEIETGGISLSSLLSAFINAPGGMLAPVDATRRYSASKLFSAIRPGTAVSIAPVRMKPRRTYDQLEEGFDPEGNYVPMLLARILSKKRSAERRMLLASLRRFGRDSGLFKDVTIKKLGRSADPFQLLFSVGTVIPSNLIDVGYGVSQVLPVVIQSVLLRWNSLLLLQQPEAQLHPKAQAALGSFFVDIVSKARKTLVIETHSDYIVDRIRQEIAEASIAPEKVVILYLEKRGIRTKIFPLTLDKLGNIEGAPPTYRDFFLRETMNLLSRGN
jgi:energy-coupling factor transporter ATP-binding protein EcfA2